MEKEINDLLLVTKDLLLIVQNIINVLKPNHSTSDIKNVIDEMIENNLPTPPLWLEVKQLKADENYNVKLFELLSKINYEYSKEYDILEGWSVFAKTCNMLLFLVENLLDVLIRNYSLVIRNHSLKIYAISQGEINRK
jgi:hypothetical protein